MSQESDFLLWKTLACDWDWSINRRSSETYAVGSRNAQTPNVERQQEAIA